MQLQSEWPTQQSNANCVRLNGVPLHKLHWLLHRSLQWHCAGPDLVSGGFIYKNKLHIHLSLHTVELISLPCLCVSFSTCYRTQIIGGVVHKIPITPQGVRTPHPHHATSTCAALVQRLLAICTLCYTVEEVPHVQRIWLDNSKLAVFLKIGLMTSAVMLQLLCLGHMISGCVIRSKDCNITVVCVTVFL